MQHATFPWRHSDAKQDFVAYHLLPLVDPLVAGIGVDQRLFSVQQIRLSTDIEYCTTSDTEYLATPSRPGALFPEWFRLGCAGRQKRLEP
jgi:hypothetical protein